MMRDEPEYPIKRQTERIPVALPVELSNGKGVTRDVSFSGVFFETDLSFSLGAPISLCLVLEHVDSNGPLRVHCRGDIVRVEGRSGTVGIAVAVAAHRLQPSGP